MCCLEHPQRSATWATDMRDITYLSQDLHGISEFCTRCAKPPRRRVAIYKGLDEQETAMPDQRNSAGDEMKASRAEGEFQRVSGIASARRDRGELSAGAYAVILDRARKSRDAANDDPGAA